MAIDIDDFSDDDIIQTLYISGTRWRNCKAIRLYVIADPLRDKIMYDIRYSGLTVERCYKFSDALAIFNEEVEGIKNNGK